MIQSEIHQDKVPFQAYRCGKCGEELLDMKQLKELATKYRQLRRAKEITFTKWGNSLAIRIPQEFVKELHIKEGSHALLKRSESGLEIVAT